MISIRLTSLGLLLRLRSAMVGVLSLVGACGGGSDPTAPPPPSPLPPTTLTLKAPPSVAVGGTLPISAVVTPTSPVSWVSENLSVATVSPTGAVTGVTPGSTTIRATAGQTSATATLTVYSPTFVELVKGTQHACARSASGALYCWGANGAGQLGSIAAPQKNCISIVGQTGPAECSSSPVPSTSSLTFVQVSAGGTHSCGLTGAGEAYCWGANSAHVLSTASETCSGGGLCVLTPLKVGGAPVFTWIGNGFEHFCGLPANGLAHCWGTNEFGQIGATVAESCDGTPCTRVPVMVNGGLAFQKMSLGWYHTCGLTTAGEAYCWGWNFYGQLGIDRTSDFRSGESSPVPVATPLRFASISAGRDHTCALTPEGIAYCWGLNTFGQLGDGTAADYPQLALVPRAVAGGLSFNSLATGLEHTCALTAAGIAYCWGHNFREASTEFGGQLGDGTFETRLTPTPVAGSIAFVQLGAGRATTCGRMATGAIYCWGSNENAQVGAGDLSTRSFTRATGVGGIP